MELHADAVVVGASLAGCTAAILLARAGWEVVLVERRPDLRAFKANCTHNIQPCATPVVSRLGLLQTLLNAGAVATRTELWTRFGWVRDPWPGLPGLNVRRELLDPALRELAVATPGVRWMGGTSARTLIEEGGRVVGVGATRGREEVQLRARLVVGADGRNSRIGALAGLPLHESAHRRFVYWAYWRGISGWGSASRMWLLDPVCAYAFPNDEGRVLVAIFVPRKQLPEWKRDLPGAYRAAAQSLPDGPDLSAARQEGRIVGRLDMPNGMRPSVRRGLALIGDAALAADPLWGVGCGWALQSGEWLADAVAPFRRRRGLSAGLARYRLQHLMRLADHYALIQRYSTGRRFSGVEIALYQAAATDPVVAHAVMGVGARNRPVASLLHPRVLRRVGAAGRGRANAGGAVASGGRDG